jgi:hypothetical protein
MPNGTAREHHWEMRRRSPNGDDHLTMKEQRQRRRALREVQFDAEHEAESTRGTSKRLGPVSNGH